MPPVQIEDLNRILEFGTLHGKIEGWVLQTSYKGGQQIKVYTTESYKNNAINTALRIRARKLMQYVYKTHNPQTSPDFRAYIKGTYLNTIYLYRAGTIRIKAKYLNIAVTDWYEIKKRGSLTWLYQGTLAQDQYFDFEDAELHQYWIDCYRNSNLFSSIEIKTVNDAYDIAAYYDTLFGL